VRFANCDSEPDTRESARWFKNLLSNRQPAAPLWRRLSRFWARGCLIKCIARRRASCNFDFARGAHDLETSAVLETGRTCKSAAVCALATLSKRLSDRSS